MPISINGSGSVDGITSINTSISSTELGYLDGVTSGLQSQINTAGGLVKITDQSFTSASAVSVNNCFSSTYTNYKIIINSSHSSTSTVGVSLRFRSSGTDYSTGTYIESLIFNTQAAGPTRSYAAALTQQQVGSVGDFRGVTSMDILSPNLSAPTYSSGFFMAVGSTANAAGISNCIEYSNSSHTGFSIYPASGTFTGSLIVYGYRN